MSVVRRGAGISAQKSKFAALSLDSLSDDSDDEDKWTQVKPTKQKTKPKETEWKDGDRPLSKNAKKRARKKRQRNISESSDGKTAESALPAEDLSWEQEVKMRNQAAADLEFQQDLEKAIMLSQVEAQDHAKLLEDSRLAERVAISESLLLSSKPPVKTAGKKGVTLSLQEFHKGEAPGAKKSTMTSHLKFSGVSLEEPLPTTPTSPTDDFFSQLNESVQKEVAKEASKMSKQSDSKESHGNTSPEELPRIAQLQDELEKRDVLIEKLKKQNELLKKALKEVKQRNQSLCKILSQGEISTKAELIEQVEQLTIVKNELTEEVESLSSSLEQERSRNKALKLSLAKHQMVDARYQVD